jgi:hypothetical protein
VRANGDVVPLDTDADGIVLEVHGDFRIYHPDERTTQPNNDKQEAQ